MSKHTPEPWVRDRTSGIKCDIRAACGRMIALCWGLSTSKAAMRNTKEYREVCDANALRIVSCVNACATMSLQAEVTEVGKVYTVAQRTVVAVSSADYDLVLKYAGASDFVGIDQLFERGAAGNIEAGTKLLVIGWGKSRTGLPVREVRILDGVNKGLAVFVAELNLVTPAGGKK